MFVRIMRTVVMAALAMLAVLIGFVLQCGGSASATPTPKIGVGSQIILIGGIGSCNVATVEGRTFKTAGHCGKVGDKFADANGAYVGKVIFMTTHKSGVSADSADYAVVEMASNVVVQNEASAHGVSEPSVGMSVCKHGHGVANAVVRCGGTIVAVTEFGMVIEGLAIMPFDSGSPVINADGQVVGIVSGSPTINDAALNAARALNISVSDGASVATRADYDLAG